MVNVRIQMLNKFRYQHLHMKSTLFISKLILFASIYHIMCSGYLKVPLGKRWKQIMEFTVYPSDLDTIYLSLLHLN